MRIHSIFFAGFAMFLVATLPARAPAQQTSSDEAQQMRQVIEQMQVQMRMMQAEIDELKWRGTGWPACSTSSIHPHGYPEHSSGRA